jgi:hypothetical protein
MEPIYPANEVSRSAAFLGKSRAGIGHSVYTRSENALTKVLHEHDVGLVEFVLPEKK